MGATEDGRLVTGRPDRRAGPSDSPVSLDGLRVGVAQVGARVGDAAANLALARRVLRRAAARGAALVVFPECFLHGYDLGAHPASCAEPANGPGPRALAELAGRFGLAIVAGFIEANPSGRGRPYNSALVVGRDGRIVGVYRKTHLFGAEFDAFAVGDAYPVFGLHLRPSGPAVRVGVCICMDIEYPEVARLLALGGAQVLAIPSADMEPYRAQQASELMARAIENNVYVALANTADRRPDLVFFGESGIAGPDGSIVRAGYLRQRLVVAELRDAAVEASGGRGYYLRGRRPETYGALVRR
jgi:predicted amidohydrolase